MRNRGATSIPVPDKDAKLKPDDFSSVLRSVPQDCVLIGGQAVAWWAQRYGIKALLDGKEQDVTSSDIDFWGTREDLLQIASSLNRKAALPNPYEMTLLVGALELRAAGKKTVLEILHAVPGLDSVNPRSVAVPQTLPAEAGARELLVLSPVSLVLVKLHALRHFSQENRQDLAHLLVCLRASSEFISELLQSNVRLALWNCNRLIDAHRQKTNKKLARIHSFRILSGVPIQSIRSYIRRAKPEPRKKLRRFLKLHWPRVNAIS